MFTIIISEKGGAERRETFEKNEISVGRVQGNDLMLPKGNVSKHHARLLYRDGRFIVTDLKSTNGTYVNGRKTSQATIVREGDKIYIGDFVLRLETGQAAPNDASRVDASAPRPRLPSLQEASAAAAASPSQPLAVAVPAALGPAPPPGASEPAAPPLPAPRPAEPAVSHFPLERDPDSESAPELRGAAIPEVPGPPRLPQAADLRPRSMTALQVASPAGAVSPVHPLQGPPAPARTSAIARPMPRETPKQAARRTALTALVGRVGNVVDLAALERSPELPSALVDQINQAAQEQAKAVRAGGEGGDGIDFDVLVREAVRELTGLGPLAPLLEDNEVTEIHVVRPDCVLVRKGGQTILADPPFTSELAVARALSRLARQSGEPLRAGDTIVDRRLASGQHLVAIGPPHSSHWILTLRRRGRVEVSLDELVRLGAMSRPMAVFLEACLLARTNVLVVGLGAGTVAPTLCALASAAPAGERIAVLQDEDEFAIANAQLVSLWLNDHASGEHLVRAAARLGADRLVVPSLGGAVSGALVDCIGGGAEGVLAGIGAPSLRHGLARLAAQVCAARPGTSMEAARELVGESFDVTIEVGRGAEGKLRVLRVSELTGADVKGVTARDLFLSNADAGGEPVFVVTGTTPRLAHEFAARGIRLDAALFRRAR
ncbi:MAG TPA: ATPase, T2SS/T4P/T4SS family [Polyangiaceae bacterium]|jgi:pilus assembly protein CpaF|nr:ATPase, T2SS/T4P/T4SS family [Polyangiaceae bacterium]